MKTIAKRFSVLLLLGLLGCDDVKTAQEVLGNRAREQSASRRAELEPLEGEYEGTRHDSRSDLSERFRLNIALTGMPYDDAGIPEQITTPLLTANAHVFTSETRSDLYIQVPFSSSDYDARSGRLNLFSEEGDSLVIQLEPGVATAPVQTLRGRYFSAARGEIGTFVVNRVVR